MSNVIELANVLRDAHLNVSEVPGWQTRGRATLIDVKGVILHHTGPGSTTGLLDLIKNGRADLAGPLSQLFLDKSGTFHVVAAGRCNHAGAGYWHGIKDGNGHFIGIEAQNAGDGKDPWPYDQMKAYMVGCAAMSEHFGFDPVMIAGHKEYALPSGRKTDPTFDTFQFRDGVELLRTAAHRGAPLPQVTDPVTAMLRKGSNGESVKVLQQALKQLGFYTGNLDGDFGPKTDTAVRAFQTAKGLNPDGKVGPKTWEALGVK